MYNSDELLRAIKIIGSRQVMIKQLGISAQRLNAWLNGHIDMGYEYALALQYLTKGQIKAHHLTKKAMLIKALGIQISIEDTREVQIDQPNTVHLLAAKGQQGLAKINMRDLFECALRLRPDRIFLSELRGEEAFAFLRAANSGHPGSLSTIHADTPQACFDQLIFMMQQAGTSSSDERLLSYIKSIVDIVVQLKRCPTPARFMYVSDVYFNQLHK